MDEIGRNNAARDALYGNEQRAGFLKWLQETEEKAQLAYNNAEEDLPETEALGQFFGAVHSARRSETAEYFSIEEEMSDADRVYHLEGYRQRLLEIQEDFRNKTEEYRKDSIYQWNAHPEFEEFANGLQAEIDAVQRGMEAIDPTLKKASVAENKNADAEQSRENEANIERGPELTRIKENEPELDEIGGNNAAKGATYGEEQRNEFLTWMEETAKKAEQALNNADPNAAEYPMIRENLIAVQSALNAEKLETLFSVDEQQMTKDERIDAMGEFKHRLSAQLEDYQNVMDEYSKSWVYQWDTRTEYKEYENRLRAEIDAVQAAMETLDPTMKQAAQGQYQSEDLNESRESEADEKEADIEENSGIDIKADPKIDIEGNSKIDIREDPQTLEQQRIRDSIATKRRMIASRAKLLKDSKTVVNSKEYYDLIDLMEKVGAGRVDMIHDKDERKQFAQELYTIHRFTERYLAHKAKDGVKKNAYRKLLAVEKASEAVDFAMAGLEDVLITTEKTKQEMKLGDISVRLESREMGGKGQKYAARSDYKLQAQSLMENNPELGGRIGIDTISDCIRSVDVCMNKILIKAENNGDQVARRSLLNMKQSFLDDPFPVVKEHAARMNKENEGRNLGL